MALWIWCVGRDLGKHLSKFLEQVLQHLNLYIDRRTKKMMTVINIRIDNALNEIVELVIEERGAN